MKVTMLLVATAMLIGLGWAAARPRPEIRARRAAEVARIPAVTPEPEPVGSWPAPQPVTSPSAPAAKPADLGLDPLPASKPSLPEGHPITALLRETKVSLDLQNGTWGGLVEKLMHDVNVSVALDQSIPTEGVLSIKVQDLSVAGILTLVTATQGAEWTIVDQSVVIRKRSQE